MNIKEKIENRLDNILNKYPTLKNFLLNTLKWYFPEDKNKLKKIYLFNTLGYVISLSVYYYIFHDPKSFYILQSSVQYIVNNALPTMYTKIEGIREILKEIIPYI
ncbi:MAG: hypothetical protein ACP5GJ_03240 [Nanopusillaceae archaeon]|jgi:hypothetical protein